MPPTLERAGRRRPAQEVVVDDEPLLASPVDDEPDEEELEEPGPLVPLAPGSFDALVDAPVVLDDEPPVPEEPPRESVR